MIDNEDINLSVQHTDKCVHCTGDMIDIQDGVAIFYEGYYTLDVDTDDEGKFIEIDIKYCPMCGRKL